MLVCFRFDVACLRRGLVGSFFSTLTIKTTSNFKQLKTKTMERDCSTDRDSDDSYDSALNLVEFSDEDETDWKEDVAAFLYGIDSRADRVFRTRLAWDEHVRMLLLENQFERTYRMSHEAFQNLVELLRPDISVDEAMSYVSSSGSTQPIIPELVLHCLLRYLSGGTYIDVRLLAQMSVASFYRILHLAIKSVCQCTALAIRFELDEESINRRMALFANLSSHQVMRGCTGCIDGILIQTKCPSSNDVQNARDYFSGHYQKYGLNMQAVCDHAYRFLWVGVNAPGGMSDNTNYQLSTISSLVEALPAGTYILGDNAYQVSENILTPFSGSQKDNIWNDSFNFHLSQLRIKIEQTFGIFNSRWGIFQKPLKLGFRAIPKMILAAAKLHNFIMRNRYPDEDLPPPSSPEEIIKELNADYIDAGPNIHEVDEEIVNLSGSSTIRQIIVQHLRSNNLTRPAHNTARNRSQ